MEHENVSVEDMEPVVGNSTTPRYEIVNTATGEVFATAHYGCTPASELAEIADNYANVHEVTVSALLVTTNPVTGAAHRSLLLTVTA